MIVKPTIGLGEAEGRRVLIEQFTAAGFDIIEDYPLVLAGVSVTLDGFDPRRNVGYEYLTREANDRAEFTDPTIGRLYQAMQRGELALLLIDGAGKPDRPMIEYLCRGFFKTLLEAETTSCERPQPGERTVADDGPPTCADPGPPRSGR